MADIEFDCSAIHFGLTKTEALMDSLSALSSALANTNINNSELTSLSLLKSSQSLVDSTMKPAVQEVYRRLTNSKNILINMDKEAELFFEYVGTGLLDDNLNFTDVPYYNQLDYYNVPFANSNIGSCGCGYTSMCMALSYLENKILTPDLRAGEVDRSAYSLESKMLKIAELENVNVYQDTADMAGLKQMLAEGKMCIVLVKDRSHFVLCKGVTDDGRILVNDPYGKWASSNPYTDAELQRGNCSRVWVIDPYKNTGAGSTSIGKVSVSQDVMRKIQEANCGKGYVEITSSKYLKAIEKSTKAKASKDYKSLLGPQATTGDNNQSTSPKLENLSSNDTGNNTYIPTGTNGSPQGGANYQPSTSTSAPSSPTPLKYEVGNDNKQDTTLVAETSNEPSSTSLETIKVTQTSAHEGKTSYSVRTWSTKTTPLSSTSYTPLQKATSTVESSTSQVEGPVYVEAETPVHRSYEQAQSDTTYDVIEVRFDEPENVENTPEPVVEKETASVVEEVLPTPVVTEKPKISEQIPKQETKISSTTVSTTEYNNYGYNSNHITSTKSTDNKNSNFIGLAAGVIGTLAIATMSVALMRKKEKE